MTILSALSDGALVRRDESPDLAPEFVEYAIFKRSNGHQVGGPVRVRAAADPRIRGLKPERYVVRRRAVYAGPWEDA